MYSGLFKDYSQKNKFYFHLLKVITDQILKLQETCSPLKAKFKPVAKLNQKIYLNLNLNTTLQLLIHFILTERFQLENIHITDQES